MKMKIQRQRERKMERKRLGDTGQETEAERQRLKFIDGKIETDRQGGSSYPLLGFQIFATL